MKKIITLIILLLFWHTNLIADEYPNSWKMDILCKQGKNEWYESSYIVNVGNNKFELGPYDNKHWKRKNIKWVGEIKGKIEYENIEISPSKGNLKRNINPSDVPFTFGEIYNKNKFFPGNLVFLGDVFNLRNTRGVTISFSPYQYNPVTKVIRVYKNIKAKIK